jgi:hypothetical protein
MQYDSRCDWLCRPKLVAAVLRVAFTSVYRCFYVDFTHHYLLPISLDAIQIYMQRLIGKVLDEEELLEQIEREEDLATLGSAGEWMHAMCCVYVLLRAVLSVVLVGAWGCMS